MKKKVILTIICVFLVAQTVVADTEEIRRLVDQFEQVARAGLFDSEVYTQEEIETAIMMTRGEDTRNPVVTSKVYRKALVHAFDFYSKKYDLPSMLFVGMALKESEYKNTAHGSRGEEGILQVGEQGRKYCKEECGAFSLNPDTQICHGFCWFNAIKNKTCDGSIRQGLYGYSSGRCEPKPSWVNTVKAVRKRYRLWGWLHLKLGREL